MKSNNSWDLLSDYFDTSNDGDQIPSKVADNIYIAWPVFLKFIATYLPNSNNKKVLDYGCGGGSFAFKLSQLGFTVAGVDSSEEMIHIAQKAYGKQVAFYIGDTALLQKIKPFELITSIMTLQFIEDIEKTIAAFSDSLVSNGLLIFAVHNPEFVKECIQKNIYLYFDSADRPTKVMVRFKNSIDVEMHVRAAEIYNTLAQKYKLNMILEKYPQFTKEFIKKYPDYAGFTNSEYLILGYRKE